MKSNHVRLDSGRLGLRQTHRIRTLNVETEMLSKVQLTTW